MLQLNYDCQMEVLSYLSPIELCAVAETCTQLKLVARDAFNIQLKSSPDSCYHITTDESQDPSNYHRILRNFGNLISTVRITDSRVDCSAWKMAFAFDWLQKYCASDKLEKIIIDGAREIVLPPSVVTLMSTVKILDIYALIHYENLRVVLSNSKKLVELSLYHHFDNDMSCGLWKNRFPDLKKLKCGYIDSNVDFNQIGTFFQNHTKLTSLRLFFSNLYFYDDVYDDEERIDLSFFKNLVDLKELELHLDFSNVEGIDTLSHLKNLQELHLWAIQAETFKEIIDSVASVDSLVTLTFIVYRDWFRHLLDIGTVFQSIKQLRKLSKLCVVVDTLEFSSLAPKEMVDVVRNLSEIKVVELDCVFRSKHLDKSFFEDLAKVSSSQRRKITLVINAKKVDNDYLVFFEKFNKKSGEFVELKVQPVKIDHFYDK